MLMLARESIPVLYPPFPARTTRPSLFTRIPRHSILILCAAPHGIVGAPSIT